MKRIPGLLVSCALAVCLPSVGSGQAAPAATASSTVPTLNTVASADQLNYSVSASQSILFGYNTSGVASSTNITGTAAYVSGSESHPFSLLYAGGYLFGDNSGEPSSTYQDFGASQELITRHFTFVVSDFVSYLPDAPVFGLSGVLGVGDIGTEPIGTGSLPVDSILTDYGRQVTNTSGGSVSYRMTAATSLNGYGNFTIQRFPDDNGIDNENVAAGASLDHRLNAQNTVGAGYVYTSFSYESGENLSVTTQEANLEYQHVFSRKMVLSASAGPQWTSTSDATYFPSRTNLGVDLSLFYSAERTHYLLSYTRGTSSGFGVLSGTLSNDVNFTADRTFGRNWSGAFSANYGYSSSLEDYAQYSSTASSFYAGVQARRQLGRSFSAYGSYSVVDQVISGPLLVNAFSGLANIIGVGITYAPRPIRMGHH